ncbi:MAG: PLP-dependent transferase, partial [Pseudomonadales bacterium]
ARARPRAGSARLADPGRLDVVARHDPAAASAARGADDRLHPMSAYMLARGMKTLELRIQRQNESALKIAYFLSKHPNVEEVFYPGLPTHKGHDFAKEQMSGFGGMMSFSLKGGYGDVKKFLPRLKWVHLAASLGSVSSLAGPPCTTSHVELTEAQRAELGIPESLIRYSVGIENIEDLIEDLTQALRQI